MENNKTQNALTDREKKELVNRIKAMTPGELAIVVENIPVSLCMARIQQEQTGC